MSDYNNEEEGFESLEEYREQEDEESQDDDSDWSNSLDDMESDDWSDQFGRSNIELEEVEDHEDFGDDEVDDLDLERIERDYFDEDDDHGDYTDSDYPDSDYVDPDYPDRDAAPAGGSGTAGERRTDDLIDRYVRLKSQLQDIQAELKELKPRVIEALAESGVVVDDRIGTVKLAKRTQWRYSDDVARLQSMIREKKREEREAGIAVVQDETPYLLVRPGGGQNE